MSGKTGIEWTDRTWNPVRGCSRVSEGCRHCYAETMAGRFEAGPFAGFAKRTAAGSRWTGKVELVPSKLAEPLSWKTPCRCFVNSMSDLFHEKLPIEHIAAVFGVMAACPHITFQVLTKRPERMREFFRWLASNPLHAGDTAETARRVEHGPEWTCLALLSAQLPDDPRAFAAHVVTRLGAAKPQAAPGARYSWPLPNVWLGVSVEDQATADARVPVLLDVPAAVRFISYEPALGPVDLALPRCERHGRDHVVESPDHQPWCVECDAEAGCYHWLTGGEGGIDWVIAGGESGPGARPAHPDWFRSVRDQCAAAGVPFLFKQWGEWAPMPTADLKVGSPLATKAGYRPRGHRFPGSGATVCRVGKKAAGRLLDGVEHHEFPESAR